MISIQEKQEIVRAMQQDCTGELPGETLETLLDAELSRPAAEMDTELVKELLELLEDGAPPQAQQQAWQRLSRRMTGGFSTAARIAATIAAVLGLFLVTWQTAEAINRRYLQTVIQPGDKAIVVTTNPDMEDAAPPTGTARSTLPPGVSETIRYTALEDSPAELLGYPARPENLPERFRHESSSLYTDNNGMQMTHVFTDGSSRCIFFVSVITAPGVSVYAQYDKTDDPVREQYICGIPVLFYRNSDRSIPSAVWFTDHAMYSLLGPMEHEEMTTIIDSTMKNYIPEE